MKSDIPKFGLVLTGGGAKGAYQVGALKYLSEIGFQPHIISGSSIGALNSAILAAYRPFSFATQRLERFWYDLAQIKPIRVNFRTAVSQVAGFFIPTLHSIMKLLSSSGVIPNSSTILDPLPIENLVRQAINIEELRKGPELWITVFPCIKVFGIELDSMLEVVRASMGAETHWICAQELEDDQSVQNLLLASAALPWVFPRRQVGKTSYIDGGLADNVPLKPLAERGCNYVIVIHLQNGVTWDRKDFPNQTIIEIRPQQPINKSENLFTGAINTFLDWSPERIEELKQRGYDDARRCMEPLFETLTQTAALRHNSAKIVSSTNSLLSSTQRLYEDEPLLDS